MALVHGTPPPTVLPTVPPTVGQATARTSQAPAERESGAGEAPLGSEVGANIGAIERGGANPALDVKLDVHGVSQPHGRRRKRVLWPVGLTGVPRAAAGRAPPL